MTYQGFVKEDFPKGTQFYYGIDIVEIIYSKTQDQRNKVIDYWDLSKITSFEPFAVHMRQADVKETVTPTLSRSFDVVPFQLGLVWLSVLSTLPPNPSACLRVGVWDKPWDKFANYFETASSQFHFCPGDKNGKALRRIIARNGCQKGRFSSLAPVWRSES